jgi:nucleotide-binding universal stress UspA family protein
MNRILVAIDFLDPTDRVINFAKELTNKLNAELLIVHSESIDSYINIISELNQQPSAELIDNQKKQFKKKLKQIHDSLTEDGIKVKCLLLEGPTVKNILEEAERFKSNLIIIGSHKHGKFYHLLLGSTHDSLISHSKIPVLTIPPED